MSQIPGATAFNGVALKGALEIYPRKTLRMEGPT